MRSPRGVLLLLAALGIAGTAAELVLERHWHSLEQFIPWAVLLPAAVATAASLSPTPQARWVWFARACAVALVAVAVVGVWRHIHANFESAPLDFRYSERWDSMSFRSQLWAAASGAVGPAPILASGVLVQIGIALGAATFVRSRSQ